MPNVNESRLDQERKCGSPEAKERQQQRHLNNQPRQRGRNNVGTNSKEVEPVRDETKDSGYRGSRRTSWHNHCITWLFLTTLISGCETLRDATYSGTGAAIGAGAATVISGGVTAPMAGALVGASTGIVLADLTEDEIAEGVSYIERKSFFTIIEDLVEVAGWGLILFFVGPIILGWILPGPLERKKKN